MMKVTKNLKPFNNGSNEEVKKDGNSSSVDETITFLWVVKPKVVKTNFNLTVGSLLGCCTGPIFCKTTLNNTGPVCGMYCS